MCLAKAYITDDAQDEMVAENVTSLKIEGDGIVVHSIMGETKKLDAVLESVDLANGKIVMRPVKQAS